MNLKIAAVFTVVLGTSLAAFAADASKLPPASDKKGVTFEKDIKPIFDHSCIKCHGEERAKAHLKLTTLEGVLKGSEDGKVVEPGKSDKSDLVFSVAHVGDPDTFMPPTKAKKGTPIPPLTKDEVGLIRAWIDQGAK